MHLKFVDLYHKLWHLVDTALVLLEAFMLENIARRFGASLLVASLWITAIAFVPAISIAQTSSTDASAAKKGPDSKDSKKSNVAPTTPTGGSTANTKPLSVKED